MSHSKIRDLKAKVSSERLAVCHRPPLECHNSGETIIEAMLFIAIWAWPEKAPRTS